MKSRPAVWNRLACPTPREACFTGTLWQRWSEGLLSCRLSRLFGLSPTQSRARLAAIAQEVDYQARQALNNDNEAADSKFVLLDGEVVLLRLGQEGKKLGPGQLAGLLAFLAGDSEPESAIATQPVCALRLDQEDLYDAMAEDFNLTRGILQAVVRWAAGTR